MFLHHVLAYSVAHCAMQDDSVVLIITENAKFVHIQSHITQVQSARNRQNMNSTLCFAALFHSWISLLLYVLFLLSLYLKIYIYFFGPTAQSCLPSVCLTHSFALRDCVCSDNQLSISLSLASNLLLIYLNSFSLSLSQFCISLSFCDSFLFLLSFKANLKTGTVIATSLWGKINTFHRHLVPRCIHDWCLPDLVVEMRSSW